MHSRTTYWFIFLTVTASYVSSSLKQTSVSYKDTQVWRAPLRNSRQVMVVKRLVEDKEISLWQLKPTHADFLVRAEQKVDVHRRLYSQNINHTVLLIDVQRRIDSSAKLPAYWNEETLRLGHRLDFTYYPDLDVIDEYFSFINDQFKSMCTIKTIGRSIENREIKMAVISNKNPKNQAILLTAGTHAREWISISSLIYILNDLVTNFDSLPSHIKNKDWYIIPVVNPDGYHHSYKVDRLWRKNRRPLGTCYGVDINRNFGKHWFVEGVSETEPCSEAYHGSSAYSEPETIAVKRVVESRAMAAYVDFHSYGQTVMYPWSAITDPTKHDKVLHDVAGDMSMAMFNKYKKRYRFGSTYHILYPASGSTIDFAYSSGINMSFVIEARDTGLNGFLLPPSEIVDTSKEVQAALYSLAEILEPKTFRAKDCHTWF